MKGKTSSQAAAREALEEAGLIGRCSKKPIGRYAYFKRQSAHFDICLVDVFLLKVDEQLKNWREKGQRDARWVTLEEAASLLQEPGLVAIFHKLVSKLPAVPKSDFPDVRRTGRESSR